jgi:hypothetical protein
MECGVWYDAGEGEKKIDGRNPKTLGGELVTPPLIGWCFAAYIFAMSHTSKLFAERLGFQRDFP